MRDNHDGKPFLVPVVLFLRHDVHPLVSHPQMLHILLLPLCVQFVDIPIQTEEDDKEQYSDGDQEVGRDGDVPHRVLFCFLIVTVSVPLFVIAAHARGIELASSLNPVFASMGKRDS